MVIDVQPPVGPGVRPRSLGQYKSYYVIPGILNHLLANNNLQKVALLKHGLFPEKQCKRKEMVGNLEAASYSINDSSSGACNEGCNEDERELHDDLRK